MVRKYFPVLIALGAVVLGAILISPSPSPSAEPSDVATTQTAPIPAGLESFYTQKLDWSKCNDTFQCTTLSVPLDYAHPAGDAISLKVIRLRAKEPKAAILLNPGGPGGSGIDYVKAAEYVTTARLRKNFDIVGFDPRGVA